MKNALPRILSLVMLFMFSGCFETPQVTIEGYSKINNNTEHRYKAVVEVDDQASIEAYQWEVVAGAGEYQLLNANSSEVTFSAVDGGNYTLKVMVTVNGKKSMAELTIIVVETQVINGYTLPPEPDPEINNATLLGIDSNTNGVRDDVERYVIIRFAQEEFPLTRTALAMQYAWAKQKIIENPTKESAKYIHDAHDCEWYWFNQKQREEEQRAIELADIDQHASTVLSVEMRKWRMKYNVVGDNNINNIVFNTRERTKRDFAFNAAMSGGVYPRREKSIEKCQTNIDLFGE